MFPSFLYENFIISYIIDYIGKDLDSIDKDINKNLNYDI
mgnify:FL=1|nr:MAG TPA: protein of unknown function (DUF5097) [Caudoviricetes sp.]